MEEKILEILKETFELDDVDKNISQQNCEAWDSMGQLNLVADLEDAFDISIDPEDIGEMKSFTDIVRILTKLGVE
ncbi:MAG: acyl carrier protein [Prevotella sp.]|nr:acyl carrier protein [Prevotella sp.]